MSEEANLAAIVALIGASAYSLDGLDNLASLPAAYNEVHVIERWNPDSFRGDGSTNTRFYRVFVRSVGKKYVNAQRMREAAKTSLRGAYVTVGSVVSTQIDYALPDDPIRPDDGWFSGTSEFHYAI